MYLLHIKPIPQDKASREIAKVYEEITQALRINTVPLVFQYVAGFEQYLFYIWDRIKRNLDSDEFHASCAELKELTYQTIGVLPTPSVPLQNFVKGLSQPEKYEITEVTNLLDDINIRLMLITIAMRESLKGIPHVGQQLRDMERAVEESFAAIVEGNRLELQGMNRKEVTDSVRMLAPLLGSNTLIVSHYPDFFAAIAAEMEQLNNTPAYLHLRVEMEHQAFERIDRFVQPLDCSYVDFLRMTDGKAYTDEILFLLKDTFPSRFPHLVLTTAVMKNSLSTKSNALAL